MPVYLGVLLGAALLGAAPASVGKPTPAQCLKLADGGELPEILEWSRDLRFATERSLYFSIRHHGIFEWQRGGVDATMWSPRGYGRDEVYLPDQLATTQERIVVGSAMFAFGFGDRAKKGLDQIYAFDEIVDIDAHGDRVAILGAQRDEKGVYAPEGALAWVGKMGADPLSWKPLFISESGKHALNFARCGRMSIGAIRYLEDGSLFLVPGVEGGGYLYDSAGELMRVFSAEQLGLDTGCPLDQKAANDFAINEEGRWIWVNERRVLDEILPLPDGRIGLVVREMKEGRPTFELIRLSRNGAVDHCPLPIENENIFARLKGDVRGNEIVFVLVQEGFRPKAGIATNILTGVSEALPAVLHPAKRTRYFVYRYQP